MSPNITRRRVIQGVGALGVAGVAGNALVSADSNQSTVQEDQAALRVAHASPDTPNVEVTLERADGGDGGVETTTTDGGDDDPLADGLGFGDVSSYEEVDPGTYQLQVVAVENTGLIEDIFSDAEERVVYDEEVELDSGTTYTAVAYGELAEADLGGEGTTGAETETDDGIGVGTETETDDGIGIGDETETETDDGIGIGDETETETDDGIGIGEETETDDGAQTGDGEVLVDQLGYGEHESAELEAGDYTLEFREVDAASDDGTGAETPTDDGLGIETETESDGIGGETETETDDGLGVETETETDAVGVETETDDGSSMDGQTDTAFQVEMLEDDLSAPGEGTGAETPGADTPTDEGGVGAETETESDDGVGIGQETETDEGAADQETTTGGEGSDTTRIRIFHAVPDVDAIEVVAVEDDGGGGLLGGGGDDSQETETETDGVGAETETETDTIGVQTETATEAGEVGGGQETETGTPGAGGEDSVREADISPEGGSVYSGFAVGYFDADAAEETATATDDGVGAETPTDDDGGIGAETPTDDDGGVGTETPTDDGGDGAGQETTTAGAEEIAEDDPEEFQFVTVEDASDGERADGGSDDGGILPAHGAPPAASD